MIRNDSEGPKELSVSREVFESVIQEEEEVSLLNGLPWCQKIRR